MSDVLSMRPMDVPRHRPVFGALVMLAVGIVFLMVNFGQLSARSLFVAFAQYWPGLLILWGISRLVDHWHARRSGHVARGLGLGGVLLLMVLLVAGSLATTAYRHYEKINWAGVREELADEELGILFGQRYQFADTLEQELPAGASVRILGDRGQLRVLPSADGRVHVSLRKTVLAHDAAEAEAIRGRVVPTIVAVRGELLVDAARRADWAGARVDMEVRVPPKAPVEIRSSRADVEVQGRESGLIVRSSHGDVTLDDVGGDAVVHIDHANVTARNVRGNVSVDGRVRDVVLSRVDGVAELRGDLYGEVRIDTVAKGVRLHSTRTAVELVRLDGTLVIADGAVRVSDATGPARLSTRDKEIDVDGIKGDLKVDNRNGEIEIEPHPKAPLGSIDVSNRSGAVRVVLPSSGDFAVDARAHHGEIASDFALTTTRGDGRTQATGVVNAGGPRVSVATENGQISIRRR